MLDLRGGGGGSGWKRAPHKKFMEEKKIDRDSETNFYLH